MSNEREAAVSTGPSSTLQQFVTIDEHELKRNGGQVSASGCGVYIKGWTIEAKRDRISGDADMESLKSRINAVNLPEQLFGSNRLTLCHHASGVSIHFDALDALAAWQEEGVEPLTVPHASEWRRSRQKELSSSGARTLSYDWTYTSSYAGTLSQGPAGHSAEQDPPSACASWQPTSVPLNKSLLLARDPILYYTELPLYESELDDNGVSSMTLKVRVMPKCAYMILRFFLRVDRVLVRLREVRLCIEFSAEGGVGVVMREVKHSEGTFEALQAAGAPPAGANAWADGDGASMALTAVAPIGVVLFRMEKLAFL